MDTDALAALDAADPLAELRGQFELPEGVIYLAGNSLGPPPRSVAARLQRAIVEEWGGDLVRAWTSRDWIGAPARVGGKIARLIGASPHEVTVADSTSVDLYKLIVAALAMSNRPDVVVAEDDFPTDLYVAEGAAGGLGRRLKRVRREGLDDAIDQDTAVVVLTHVNYRTAEVFDMSAVTARAHAAGALVLWDLSHSTGAVPVDLNAAGADLAVGCGYKYLNGGPGAPAYLFVAERWQERLVSPLSGWMGHAAPFAFAPAYAPSPGINRFLCGTPPILSLLALEAGIDLILQADVGEAAAKSRRLGDLMLQLVAERCPELEPVCPGAGRVRGGHVAFRHHEGYAISRALIAVGVIGDFRAPDVIRFGLSPLFLSYADIGRAVEILGRLLDTRGWDRPEHRAHAQVT